MYLLIIYPITSNYTPVPQFAPENPGWHVVHMVALFMSQATHSALQAEKEHAIKVIK